jgi:AcrR family transcriptional regulator
MNIPKQKRTYSMTNRTEQVMANEKRIMETVISLWMQHTISEITLERVASISGVTVRTLLRKYSSKEGLLEACVEYEHPGFLEKRNRVEAGDIDAALMTLLNEYEEMGNGVMRTIAVEDEMSFARKLLIRGRKEHRAWCARVFGPFLPEAGHRDYEIQLAALIAVTEIYLWKLLRKDLGHNREDTARIFQLMTSGIIEKIKKHHYESTDPFSAGNH